MSTANRTNADRLGFRITEGKGFQITFKNGYTVSVQFGPGNYSDNYAEHQFGGFSSENQARCGRQGSTSAECAVWGPDGEMIPHFDGQTVSNRSTPSDVLELLNWASAHEATS